MSFNPPSGGVFPVDHISMESAEGQALDFSAPLHSVVGEAQAKPWQQYRRDSERVSSAFRESFDVWHQRLAKRIEECANNLFFSLSEHQEECKKPSYVFEKAQFCRCRWCVLCQWRRSQMLAARFYSIIDQDLPRLEKLHFLSLTLTVRNVPAVDLRDALVEMNAAFYRLVRRKEFLNAVVGWVKSIEVTREEKRSDYCHPHFHVLLAVVPNYFHRSYISKPKWIELWRDCLRADYDPNIDIRPLRYKEKKADFDAIVSICDYVSGAESAECLEVKTLKEEFGGESGCSKSAESAEKTKIKILKRAIPEFVKYAFKPSDIFKMESDPNRSEFWYLYVLTEQIHRKHFFASGGIWRELLREEHTEYAGELRLRGEFGDEDYELLGFMWGRYKQGWKPKYYRAKGLDYWASEEFLREKMKRENRERMQLIREEQKANDFETSEVVVAAASAAIALSAAVEQKKAERKVTAILHDLPLTSKDVETLGRIVASQDDEYVCSILFQFSEVWRLGGAAAARGYLIA